jgi:Mrp family chromosome partitioning ATPase
VPGAHSSADLLAVAEAMGSGRAERARNDIEELARELSQAGEGGRRVTILGAAPNAAIGLARRLAQVKRVILLELTTEPSGLSGISSDPGSPGLAQLVAGEASFGEIITRDRFSAAHLILAGHVPLDAQTILGSERLTITIEALSRTYDHVLVGAGAAADAALTRLAALAPRAVLVSSDDGPKTALARERLLTAGFTTVDLLAGAPKAAIEAA